MKSDGSRSASSCASRTAPFDPSVARRVDDLRAVELEQALALLGRVLGHDAREPVAAQLADQRERDAGVAARRLDHARARLEVGAVEHRLRDAVLDRAGRVLALELRVDAHRRLRREVAQLDERRVADQVERARTRRRYARAPTRRPSGRACRAAGRRPRRARRAAASTAVVAVLLDELGVAPAQARELEQVLPRRPTCRPRASARATRSRAARPSAARALRRSRSRLELARASRLAALQRERSERARPPRRLEPVRRERHVCEQRAARPEDARALGETASRVDVHEHVAAPDPVERCVLERHLLERRLRRRRSRPSGRASAMRSRASAQCTGSGSSATRADAVLARRA